jgi:hypothetical protein
MITLTNGKDTATIDDNGSATGDAIISAFAKSYIYALSTSDGDPHMNLASFIKQNPSIGYTVVDATFIPDESVNPDEIILY